MTYDPVTIEHLLAHRSWAISVARQLVREESEAEDLVQRTWLAALRRPPSRQRGARAWIRTVILNLVRERHRRTETRTRLERTPRGVDAELESEDAFEDLARRELRELLATNLLAVREPYRSVLIQRYYDGLSSAEIARRMGVPPGTVRWRLKVGLDELRERLDHQNGEDRSRWVLSLLPLVPQPERSARPVATRAPLSIGTLPLVVGLGLLASGLALTWVLYGRDSARALPRSTGNASVLAMETGERVTSSPLQPPLPERTSPLLEERSSSSSVAPVRDELDILVVDESDQPVPGATVLVATASGYHARSATGEQGTTRLTITPGDVGALGLAACRGRVAVGARARGRVASELVHVAPPFTAEHRVRLVIGGTARSVKGRVLGDHDLPLAGAVVVWLDPDWRLESVETADFSSPSYVAATTDAQGFFELDYVRPQHGSLFGFAEGYAIGRVDPAFDEGRAEVELHLDRGVTLTGRIHWPGGRAAQGTRIGIEPLLRSSEWAVGLPRYLASWRGFVDLTHTDEQGRFRLEGVHPGRRTIWALDEESGRVASATLELEPGRSEHWDAELGERPGFRLQLVDEAGQPLEGWFAQLRRNAGGGPTWVRWHESDEQGRVLVTDCSADRAFLQVFDSFALGAPYATYRLEPSLEEQVIRVETLGSCSIAGRVVDDQGRPELRGKLKLLAMPAAVTLAIKRNADGSFQQRLGPGTYLLDLDLESCGVELARIRLEPLERRELGTLSTPPMGTLRLDAAALANGEVRQPSYSLLRLLDPSRKNGFQTIGSGKLSVETELSVFPGSYRLLAFDGAGGMRAHEVEVRACAETRLELLPSDPLRTETGREPTDPARSYR